MSTQPVDPAPGERAAPAYEPVQPTAPAYGRPAAVPGQPVAPAPVQPVATGPRTSMAGLAIRILLTLAGAAGLVIGSFMAWFQGTVGTKVSMKTYIGSPHIVGEMIRSAGAVTIVIGLLAILGLAPRSGWLTRIAGVLGIAAFVLFAVQVYRAPGGSFSDIGVGAWIVLAGSVVALIGGFFGKRYRVVYSGPTAVETAA